ncbi:MAG TPA: RNA polymerase sigma factor [Propionibacteriaceae bacterium]|nr:RNA polymerase sigma factor [Propionibacteriaceae bacterium]
MTGDIADTVAAVWRIESARLTAALLRRTGGDLGLAEDLAQDTFAAALRQWPVDGVPRHPGSWLMATAHHRLVDHARRRTLGDRKHALYAADQPDSHDAAEEVTAMLDDPVRDDELTLILMSCHPALSRENQIALTLKVVAGLQTAEIARAFLVSEATAAQRIVRAKRRLAATGARFDLPTVAGLPARLAVVLAVVYAIFNEGYASAAGEDWTRPELCHDALRLGRRLVALQPTHPEAQGLVALMELQASRLPARHSPDGTPVLLEDQDRRRWDRLLIRRGLADLARAGELGGGPYTLQAEIAACHARAVDVASTDWRRITALYTVLRHLTPSPVLDLNHAVAVSRADGPAAGLKRLDALVDVESLQRYPLFHAARGDVLERLGRYTEATAAFNRAAELESNEPLRAVFLGRATHRSAAG